MDAAIARDSLAAWKSFRTLGGIEVGGRDADFEAKLKQLLAPLAPDLETALEACSTDDLVRALFQVVSPFAEMFRNIVAFFQTAGANQGREQWMIKIEEDGASSATHLITSPASLNRLTEVVGLKRFAIYVFDYGAPVGFRIAQFRPDSHRPATASTSPYSFVCRPTLGPSDPVNGR